MEAENKGKEITNDSSLLKAMILVAAREKFQNDITEEGNEDSIGPDQEFENKDEWMSYNIKQWADEAGMIVDKKRFESSNIIVETNVNQAEFAQNYYDCDLGSYMVLEFGDELHRVPGGWILRDTNGNASFAKFSDEFLFKRDINLDLFDGVADGETA